MGWPQLSEVCRHDFGFPKFWRLRNRTCRLISGCVMCHCILRADETMGSGSPPVCPIHDTISREALALVLLFRRGDYHVLSRFCFINLVWSIFKARRPATTPGRQLPWSGLPQVRRHMTTLRACCRLSIVDHMSLRCRARQTTTQCKLSQSRENSRRE